MPTRQPLLLLFPERENHLILSSVSIVIFQHILTTILHKKKIGLRSRSQKGDFRVVRAPQGFLSDEDIKIERTLDIYPVRITV